MQVIDGCQALGLSVGMKYERPYGAGRDVRDIRDGASLPRLFALLQSSARPLIERQSLLRWAILQVLIGNPDAHAKNLSFYSSAQGLSLAPAYDLVSMPAFDSERLDRSYALAIGDAFTAEELSPFEWALFASRCELPRRFLVNELAYLAAKVREALAPMQSEAQAQGANAEMLARITSTTAAECERQLAMASRIAAVSLG